MMQQELEQDLKENKGLTMSPFTGSEWRIINQVYTFHPAFSDKNGKEEIAYLFVLFGRGKAIRILCDMLPTADKFMQLEERKKKNRKEMDAILEEMDSLSNCDEELETR